jgi:hypothetical protein
MTFYTYLQPTPVWLDTAIDGRWVNVEGPCDGADGFAFENELASELSLIGAHFLRAPECHAARHRRLSPLVRPPQDKRPFELGDPGEDGHDHHAGRGRGVGPRLVKRL